MSSARARWAAWRWNRKRQRLVVVTSGAFATAIGTAISIATFSGIDVVAAAAQKAQSVADLLAQRSPGERTAAQLTKTKHKKYFAVLPAREQPEATPVLPPPVAEALLPAPVAPLIPETLPALAAAAPPVPAIFGPIVGGGIFFPGGGGPGGGGGPPGQPPPPPPGPPPPPTITPAVPEPATWAMMILGFGFAGLQLRRRRAAELSSAPR